MDERTTSRTPSGWRGDRPTRDADARRRWQRDASAGSASGRSAPRLPLALRLAALFAATLLCLIVFLVLILSRPLQVPLIALTAAPYPSPLPPNGWAEEDVEGLAALDGKTITLHDARGTGSSRTTILESLQNRLDEAAAESPRGPMILYFNAHAAVDGEGRPCLVPPQASPVDSASWLPVADIFDVIAERRGAANGGTLVIFDTNRLDAEWQLGIVRNTFVERLTELLDAPKGPRSEIPSLAVLTAAGRGEVSQVSPELGGSVFAHFLRLGLAGRADRSDIVGDGDSRVSLRELHAYLSRTVTRWSRDRRDVPQTPVLSVAKGVDFPMTWVCRTALPERTVATPSVKDTDIAALWHRTEALERHRPVRYAPLAWAEIRRTLLYLEQAARAGRDYAATARATAEDLAARLSTFERQAATAGTDRWNVFRTDTKLTPVPARSLALSRAFGRGIPAAIAEWDTTDGRLSAARLERAAELDLAEGGPVDEAHFLRLLAQSPAQSAPPDDVASVIALHRLSLTAASPADERAWSWIREPLQRGDASRRMVEDALMAGESVDEKTLAQSEAAYRTAIATSDAVIAAHDLLDRVQADQLHLSAWLTDRRQRHVVEDGPGRRATTDHNTTLINAVLLPMIAEANRLSDDLRSTDPGRVSGLNTRTATVRGHYDRLRSEFDRSYGRLLEESRRTAAVLRDMDVVLAVPLLPSTGRQSMTPAQQRSALRRRRGDIVDDLAAAAPADRRGPASRSVPQNGTHWTTHPLSAVFGEAWESGRPTSIADPRDAERIGELTRDWLAVLDSTVLQDSAEQPVAIEADSPPAAEATSSGDAPIGDSLLELVREAENLRIAATLQPFRPASAVDAISRLNDVQLAELLIGQADRKLDDFWGPARPGESSFFLTAADDLDAAETLAAGDGRLAARIAEYRNVLEQRTEAARNGLRVKVSDVLLTSPGRDATTVVTVWPGTGPASGVVPDGAAAVVAGLPGDWALAEPRRVVVPAREGGSHVELSVHSGAADTADARARVGVLFRGHLFDAPLMMSAASGPTVTIVPAAEVPTTLTVRSSQRQELSVVFVLDCSASMAAGAGSEGTGAASTRLDLAREALSRMLSELAARPGARVGVVFYGHRVGWRKVTGEMMPDRFQRSVQHDYARTVSDDVMPYNDVEVVEPLGRFDGAVAGEVEDKLERVQPWGETPLYLAIDEALRQFGEGDSTERSVIVITDGLNEQSNPSAAARRTMSDVLTTWQRRKAAIEIIGFGLSEGDAGRASIEFGQLADATGGHYESVDRATDLIAALERRLGAGSYRVRPLVRGDETTAAIGEAVELSALASLPSGFRVRVEERTADVRAEGGEALELIAGEIGPILSARYLAGSPKFAALVADDSAARTGRLLGLHRPLRAADGSVTFEFSLQNEDQSFLARPSSVWVEVTPVGGESRGSAAPYIFFHREFVPQTPVPVLRGMAANWPKDAAAARVRFWCRDASIEAVGTLAVADLLDAAGEQSLPGAPNVGFEAFTVQETDGVRIDVVERHAGDSDSFGLLGLTWSGAEPPREFLHCFDAERGVVLHTLRFDTLDDARASGASLVVFHRDAIETGGMRLDPPAVIDVGDQADLLTPFRSPYTAEPAPRGAGNAQNATTGPAEPPVLLAPADE